MSNGWKEGGNQKEGLIVKDRKERKDRIKGLKETEINGLDWKVLKIKKKAKLEGGIVTKEGFG